MQIIIDIPEWKYKSICEGVEASKRCGVIGIDSNIHEAIYSGIPLPKGHGRLIDADAFKKEVCTYQQTGCGDCKHSLCCPEDAPTIIEADKEN